MDARRPLASSLVCTFLSVGKHRGAAGAPPAAFPKPHPGASDSAFDSFPAFGFKLFIHDKYYTDPYLMSQLK